MSDSSETSEKVITIDLEKLEYEGQLQENELINGDLCRELSENILATVNANKGEKNCKRKPCFFIDGPRGSGKSTVLRFVKERVTQKKSDQTSKETDSVNIELLADLDPTELAEGELFFLYILSHIMKRLGEAERKHLSDDEKSDTRDIHHHIEKMAEGLKLLQSTKDCLKNTGDAALFLEDFMDKCSSSSDLKQEFHQAIDKLCRLLGIDAFLVTIDDADMNATKCREVLESVRKYMLSPRLVFIFAGDLKLYSLIVRNMQMELFSNNTLQHDETHKEVRMEIIDELETQYLIKLLPVEHRYTLGNFGTLLNRKYTYQLEYKDRKEDIRTVLRNYEADLLPFKYLDCIDSLLMIQPIRTILQLLQNWWIKSEEQPSGEDHSLKLGNQILATCFATELTRHQIDYRSILSGNVSVLFHAVLDVLKNHYDDNPSSFLLPITGDSADRASTLFLGTQIRQNLSKAKDQLLFQCSIYPFLFYLSGDSARASNPIYMRLFERLVSNRNEHFGIRITSMLAPDNSGTQGKRFGQSTIQVLNYDSKATATKPKRIAISTYIKAITEEQYAQNNRDIRFVCAMYHSLNIIRTERERNYYLSFYGLIDCIIKLLSLDDAAIPDMDTEIADLIFPTSLLPSVFRPHIGTQEAEKNTSNQTEVSISRLFGEYRKHLYTVTDEGTRNLTEEAQFIVALIKDWRSKSLTQVPALNYAADYGKTWSQFMTRCETIKESEPISGTDEKKLANAGRILQRYMNAFTQCIDDNYRNSSIRSITKSFPLWEAILDADAAYDQGGSLISELWEQTIALNIGAVTLKATRK